MATGLLPVQITAGHAFSLGADTDWTERFPRIREALASLEARSATIDGEAVVCCPKSGLTLFDRLHSGKFDREVILYAFDLLELNGDDLRKLPLCQRKAKLSGRTKTWIKVKNPDSPAMTRCWER